MADEKFSIEGVSKQMQIINDYFAEFATTLKNINSYIEANVNASLGSSAYGDLGGRLLTLWDHNSSTFQDFNENFDTWSKVVSIICANNNKFAVEAQATYRDNGGTLDGVKEAREFISKNNSLENINKTEGYENLSQDAKAVLDSAYRMETETVTNNNEYGGKTVSYVDSAGRTISIYYDKDGKLVGRKVGDKIYAADGTEISKLPTGTEYEEEQKKKAEEEEAAKKPDAYLDPEGFGGYRADFVNSLVEGAIATYKKYGVLPSLTIAQAVMETGWGKSPIGHNLFGIKAGSKWTGKVVRCGTHEQKPDGTVVQTSAVFRDYDSYEESIEDHGKLVSQGRYEKVPQAKNYKEAAQAVAKAGYATSLNYADSLIGLIEKYGFDQWDPKS